jgi:hypothetical protein
VGGVGDEHGGLMPQTHPLRDRLGRAWQQLHEAAGTGGIFSAKQYVVLIM